MIAPVIPAAPPAPTPSAQSPGRGNGSDFGDLLHSATTESDTTPAIADQNRQRGDADRGQVRANRSPGDRDNRDSKRATDADHRDTATHAQQGAAAADQRDRTTTSTERNGTTSAAEDGDATDATSAADAVREELAADDATIAEDETAAAEDAQQDAAETAAAAAIAAIIPTDAPATGSDATTEGDEAIAPTDARAIDTDVLEATIEDGTATVGTDAPTSDGAEATAGDGLELDGLESETGHIDEAADLTLRPEVADDAVATTDAATDDGPAAPTVPVDGPAADGDETIDLTDAGSDPGPDRSADAPTPAATAATAPAPPPTGDAAPDVTPDVAVASAPVVAEAPTPHPAPVVTAAPMTTNAPATGPVTLGAAPLPPEIAPEIHEQLINRVSGLRELGDGAHELVLELDPVELGHLRLEVVMRDGAVNLKIQADDPSTRALLQQTIADLRSALDDAGLQTGFLDVADQGTGGGSADDRGNQPPANEPAPAIRKTGGVILPDRVDVLL